jgi:predicted protein tyrosine phosphatase
MRFKIFSQKMAEDRDFVLSAGVTEPHVWISITSPGDPRAILPPDPNRLDVLFMEFWDVEIKRVTYDPITEDQASEIVKFVQKYLEKVDLVCVNCQAGISRSAGCASGLSILFNGHDRGIGDSPLYHPNVLVKSLILKHGWNLAPPHTV